MSSALQRAITQRSETALSRAIGQVERYHLVSEVQLKYDEAKVLLSEMPRTRCLEAMQEALTARTDEAKFKHAINQAIDLNMTNEMQYLAVVQAFRELKNYPPNWDVVTLVNRDVWKPIVRDQGLINALQQLFDKTFIKRTTRDRLTAISNALKVEKVVQIQLPENYLRYVERRDKIFKEA